MSEYTPTTAEIEDWYAYDEWDTGPEEETPRREEFRRWHAAEIRRAKTISAEQVEAATAEAHRIGYTEHNGLPKAWAEQYVRAAFRAAGFYVEEDNDVSEA